jgi:hypothetical protein
LTAIRSLARLTVFEKSRNKIVVMGDVDCEFDYQVNGVRRGYTDYTPFSENTTFRPTVAGVPFGMDYPKSYRDILVRAGILNADYTPNEVTAQRLGWNLELPKSVDTVDVPQR